MRRLGECAAAATIIAAVFTVLMYFDRPQEARSIGGMLHSPMLPHPQVDVEEVAELRSSDGVVVVDADRWPDSELDLRQKLAAAMRIPNAYTKGSALRELAKKAADSNLIPLAYEASSQIPNEFTRGAALKYVAKAAAQAGDIESAVKIAETIPNTFTRSIVLDDISKM